MIHASDDQAAARSPGAGTTLSAHGRTNGKSAQSTPDAANAAAVQRVTIRDAAGLGLSRRSGGGVVMADMVFPSGRG